MTVLTYNDKCKKYLESDAIGIKTDIIVQVLTDEEDNISAKADSRYPEKLQLKANEMQKDRCACYLHAFGRSLNSARIAQEMGFPIGNTTSVKKTEEGLNDLSARMIRTTMNFKIMK